MENNLYQWVHFVGQISLHPSAWTEFSVISIIHSRLICSRKIPCRNQKSTFRIVMEYFIYLENSLTWWKFKWDGKFRWASGIFLCKDVIWVSRMEWIMLVNVSYLVSNTANINWKNNRWKVFYLLTFFSFVIYYLTWMSVVLFLVDCRKARVECCNFCIT